MADTFISYKSEDRAWAVKLASFLTENGLSVWWDREILAGENYSIKISSELRASQSVAVIWSPRAAESEYVLAEAHYARAHKKLVCTRSERMDLPVPFNIYNYVDLTNLNNPEYQKALLKGIRAKLPDTEQEPEKRQEWVPFVLFPISFQADSSEKGFIDSVRSEIDSRNVPVFVREAVPFGHVGVGYRSETEESKSLFEICKRSIPIFIYLGWPSDESSGYVWDIVIPNLSDVVAEIDPVQVFIGDTFAPKLSHKFNKQDGEYFELGGTSNRPTIRLDEIPQSSDDRQEFIRQLVDEIERRC